MFDFFGIIASKIVSAVAAVIIAVGIVSVPDIPEEITNNPIQEENQSTTTAEEIEELRKEIEELKKKQTAQVTEPKIVEKVIEKIVEIPRTDKKVLINTFTTPSGVILDENGNIISDPTKSVSSDSLNKIVPGTSNLSGEQIYSIISPSVVLVKSSNSGGTGFIVSSGKYTITNAHVVGSDDHVILTFQSGANISAPVLGRNGTFDIALVYNNNLSLPYVKFGTSESPGLTSGADVYAFGFPLSYENTVTLTKGIVSAIRQNVGNQSYIQTDATIHPGNSGGPLVNNRGEVIGINTRGVVSHNIDVEEASISAIGGTGIGFSIPIETAKALIPSLSQNGQSRYELYPVGSTQKIRADMELTLVINPILSCEMLNFTGEDLTICNLFRLYHDDYVWEVTQQ